MKRGLVWLGTASLLIGLGIWGWSVFFPGPEEAVRKRLLDLAQTATVPPNEAQWARMAKAHKLLSFFTTNVELIVDAPGQPQKTLSGFDELREAALASRVYGKDLRIEFVDVDIVVDKDEETASAHLTAKIILKGELNPQELKIQFRKVGGDWLIERGETVRTLR